MIAIGLGYKPLSGITRHLPRGTRPGFQSDSIFTLKFIREGSKLTVRDRLIIVGKRGDLERLLTATNTRAFGVPGTGKFSR